LCDWLTDGVLDEGMNDMGDDAASDSKENDATATDKRKGIRR
jgi:hypothetical protein